ncbi:MAG: hypothetical protein CM15mP120_18580 [Pseudomonadota bacterium]|nr:MAG: hypothetical protein CM15mP120_18580 [Pseudomonadota bacterium]
MTLTAKLREDWALRPWWMNGLFYFFLYMTFVYMPFDMFLKPVAEDHEIWFGFALTGWWAKPLNPCTGRFTPPELMVSGVCVPGCGLGLRSMQPKLS